MDQIKELLETLVQNCLSARNEATDKEDDDENASNQDVDKRKLIDEVGGILKDKVDEELWRTIIGKIEKAAYEKSEAGINKAEDDFFQDEDDIEEEEKAANSIDKTVNRIYSALIPSNKDSHISSTKGIELGKQIYG